MKCPKCKAEMTRKWPRPYGYIYVCPECPYADIRLRQQFVWEPPPKGNAGN